MATTTKTTSDVLEYLFKNDQRELAEVVLDLIGKKEITLPNLPGIRKTGDEDMFKVPYMPTTIGDKIQPYPREPRIWMGYDFANKTFVNVADKTDTGTNDQKRNAAHGTHMPAGT